MPGFDINRFIDLSEREAKHLICSICLNIYDNAVITLNECEHNFCKDCVQQWIDNNHKECPECRTMFATRKRTNAFKNDNNLVIVRNFIFKRNLLINNMINELQIKCNFDFNGCQQSVKLSQLSAHIRECEHRLCDNCGLTFGKREEHKCIELLKNNRNEWKEKYEKQLEFNNKLKEENSVIKTKLQTNDETIEEFKQNYDRFLDDINQLKLSYDKQLEINNKLKKENIGNETKFQTNEGILKKLKENYKNSLKGISKLKRKLQTKDNENKDLIILLNNNDLFKLKIKTIIQKTLEKVPDLCDSSQSFTSYLKDEVQHYLSGLLLLSQHLDSVINGIQFGNYTQNCEPTLITFEENIIKFNSIQTNYTYVCQTIDLNLSLNQLQEVVFSPDDSSIYLKITKQSCDSIAESLALDDNSPNTYRFDVNSNDSKERYIKIYFRPMTTNLYLNCYLRCLKLSEPTIKFIKITLK